MSKHFQQAFTLIELVMTMTIMAILTAMGIPAFRQLYEYTEMQRVTSDFTSVLRYAQQRAIQERVPIRMEIDVDKNTYWVPVEQKEERRHYVTRRRHRSSSSRRASHQRNQKVKEVKAVSGFLTKGFEFEFFYKVAENKEIRRNEGSIVFYPDGSADETFLTILWMAPTKEEEKRLFLKISPATGFVSSMEGRTQQDGSDFYRGNQYARNR